MGTIAKQFLGSLLAIVTSVVLIIVALVVVVAVCLSSLTSELSTPIERGSVLEINMDEAIADSPDLSPISTLRSLLLGEPQSVSMLSMLRSLEFAADDPNITALSLRLDGASSIELAQASELRGAIATFRQVSGKPVYAYSEGYSQVNYMLASVADSVALHPLGAIEWKGVGSSTAYYGDMLSSLGVEVEVFRPRDCPYKSAIEPYTLSKMSSESRKQSQTLVESLWSSLVGEVAQARSLNSSTLRKIARDEIIVEADRALKLKLVDALTYRDQYDALLKNAGVVANKNGAPKRVTIANYSASIDAKMAEINLLNTSRPKVAVIYVDGVIVDGEIVSASDGDAISGVVARELRRARLDDNVKAAVVRVNSPGGSALAADVIWREMSLLHEVKPLIVSMGSYAASGGYYVSAPADIILASPYTITGSIGVYGVMFAYDDALRRHLKITHDGVVSSPSANFGREARKVTPLERAAVMRGVDEVYDTFRAKVASGRELTPAAVDAVSGGRVWSGTDALNRGLVDGIGGLTDAITLAMERCGYAKDGVEVVEYGADRYEGWLPLTKGVAKGLVREVIEGVTGGASADILFEMRDMHATQNGVYALTPVEVAY